MPEAEPPPAPDKVAIVLVAGLAPGQAANIAACLAAGLAGGAGAWAAAPLVDAAGLQSVASSHLPIAILRAEPAAMQALMQTLSERAADEGGRLCLFPAYAQTMHDCNTYWQRHRQTRHAAEPMLGLGLAGPKRWVNRWSGSLPLWR